MLQLDNKLKLSVLIWRITMDLSRGIVVVLQIIIVLQANAYDECEEIGICDRVDHNYPTALAKELIRELKSKNTLFNSDEFEIDLGFRFDNDRQELCEITKKQLIPTEGIEYVKGKKRFIVNDIDKPVQKFNSAICKNKESNCTDLLGFIPNYKGVCIQKSVLREIIYINDKNESETGYFKIPTCCSCKLLRIN